MSELNNKITLVSHISQWCVTGPDVEIKTCYTAHEVIISLELHQKTSFYSRSQTCHDRQQRQTGVQQLV